MKPSNKALVRAIRSRSLIELSYGPVASNDAGEVRICEPYIYGRSADGIEFLRAYQLRGGTASGQEQGWKMFRMERVRRLRVLDGIGVFDPGARREYKGKPDPVIKDGCFAATVEDNKGEVK